MSLWFWVPAVVVVWLVAGFALALVIGPAMAGNSRGPEQPGSDEGEAA